MRVTKISQIFFQSPKECSRIQLKASNLTILCISIDLAAAADRCMMMLCCSIVSQRTQTAHRCCRIQWQQNVPTSHLDQTLNLQLKVIITFIFQRFLQRDTMHSEVLGIASDTLVAHTVRSTIIISSP